MAQSEKIRSALADRPAPRALQKPADIIPFPTETAQSEGRWLSVGEVALGIVRRLQTAAPSPR